MCSDIHVHKGNFSSAFERGLRRRQVALGGRGLGLRVTHCHDYRGKAGEREVEEKREEKMMGGREEEIRE